MCHLTTRQPKLKISSSEDTIGLGWCWHKLFWLYSTGCEMVHSHRNPYDVSVTGWWTHQCESTHLNAANIQAYNTMSILTTTERTIFYNWETEPKRPQLFQGHLSIQLLQLHHYKNLSFVALHPLWLLVFYRSACNSYWKVLTYSPILYSIVFTWCIKIRGFFTTQHSSKGRIQEPQKRHLPASNMPKAAQAHNGRAAMLDQREHPFGWTSNFPQQPSKCSQKAYNSRAQKLLFGSTPCLAANLSWLSRRWALSPWRCLLKTP